MAKRNIICDNMIWYYIGNNLIDISEFNDDNLIATRVNIFELENSFNIVQNFDYYRNALGALLNHSSSIIKLKPIEYLYNCGNQTAEFDSTEVNKKINAFMKIANLPANYIMPEIYVKKFAENSKAYANDLTSISEFFNLELIQVKKNIKEYLSKRIHRQINNECQIKMHIKKVLRRRFFINWNHYNWDNIDFFIKVYSLYFKQLELLGNSRIKENDWYDLFNLVYVKPNYFYLTCEKKWYNLIKSTPNLKNKMIFRKPIKA